MWHHSSRGRNVKRLFRHLFTFCSAVSLLLLVAVCGLWVRSFWVADYLSIADRKTIGRNGYDVHAIVGYSSHGGFLVQALATRFHPKGLDLAPLIPPADGIICRSFPPQPYPALPTPSQ